MIDNEPKLPDWLVEARRFSRQKVIEAGLTDDDIDRLIKQAQHEVEPIINARLGLDPQAD